MTRKHPLTTGTLRWIAGALLVAAINLAFAAAINVAFSEQAHAQRYNRGGNFFERLFGGFRPPPVYREERRYDSSRPPPPTKEEPEVEPTTQIVVMGDAMASWLAFGLEEAFEDAPEIGFIRETESRSGLVRYKYRSELDWWDVARDVLSRKKKVDYVVMMLGVYDRRTIHDTSKDEPEPNEPATDESNNQQPSIVAPEKPEPSGPAQFRSERWVASYTKRIDATMAALRSKGVPVLWVGLPSIRGTRSTADAAYLNDLYRARAERAGAIYVDIWDGFVDENGKFSYHGPDYEGQTRRLRAGDGVYFTEAGARKLAHYVERELRRLMANRAVPVALPSGAPISPLAPNAPRPLAGPVVPLTVTPTANTELLGAPGTSALRTDPVAGRVLVKGEAVDAAPGRADDFSWPRKGTAEAATRPIEPAEENAAVPAAVKPAAKQQGKKAAAPGQARSKTTGEDNARQQPAQRETPRPPRPVGRSTFDPFAGLR